MTPFQSVFQNMLDRAYRWLKVPRNRPLYVWSRSRKTS